MHGSIMQDADLRALRRAVFADPALQARLAAVTESEPFAAALTAEARTMGIALAPDRVAALLAPDPLGLARFAPAPPDGAQWPAGPWLPVSAGGTESLDWLYFGDKQPTEPFFEETIRTVQRLPFNRAFRYRMLLADLIEATEAASAPDGLIFHMSRCGSTLTGQMLAALPGSLVLSEPPALDAVLQCALRAGPDAAVAALRAIVAALGRLGGRPYVLKLDCWHALALPLFRRAFPRAPWIFLYRDPVEVLLSHQREPCAQIAPEFMVASLGLETGGRHEDDCARALAAICAAAVRHLALGGGIAVDYRQLPAAVAEIVLPHFQISTDARRRAAMAAAGLRDAKAPHRTFVADAAVKRHAASLAVEAAAARHLAGICAKLDAKRQAAPRRDGVAGA